MFFFFEWYGISGISALQPNQPRILPLSPEVPAPSCQLTARCRGDVAGCVKILGVLPKAFLGKVAATTRGKHLLYKILGLLVLRDFR